MIVARGGAGLPLRSWLALLMLFWILGGCAVLPPAPRGTLVGGDAGRALLADWLSADSVTHSLQGVAKVRVETPERTVNGTQVLLAEAPDRLRTEVLSPFGTPLLVLAANGADLGVLLPGDNLFYQGQATPENLGKFTRLPLRLADLVGIVLARPPLIAYRDVVTYLLPDGGWRVELTAGQQQQQLAFDQARQLLEVRYLHGGELHLHLLYSEYAGELPGLPHRIVLELPLQQTRASLAFTELAVDRQFQPALFTLTPPPGAQVVALDEALTAKPAADEAGNAAAEHRPPQQEKP